MVEKVSFILSEQLFPIRIYEEVVLWIPARIVQAYQRKTVWNVRASAGEGRTPDNKEERS